MIGVEEAISMLGDDCSAQFLIDNDLRVVSIPPEGVILGVQYDKDVNYVEFVMPRFYKKQDLAGFSVRIIFSNARGEYGYYSVPTVDVNDETLVFSWLLDYNVTLYVGSVRFVVRLYTADQEGMVKQAFDTTPGEASVLEGMTVDESYTPSEVEDILAKLQQYADSIMNTATEKLVAKVDDKLIEIDKVEAAEEIRVTSETARVSNEKTRDSNENDRIANESARISAEDTRANNETARVSNEKTRDSNEATRSASETSRISNETTRATAEAKRVSAETDRNNAETTRVSNEEIRVSNEAARSTDETARASNEDARISAESKRVAAETDRTMAETTRVSNETTRVSNETTRTATENIRISNEKMRGTNEDARISAETDRVNAETKRASNEESRNTNEASRSSNETARISNESTRSATETKRVAAETDRVNAETKRVNAEAARVTTEESRIQNEAARIANETARTSAEATRMSEHATAIAEATAATTAANAATDSANAAATSATNAADAANKAAESIANMRVTFLQYDSESGTYTNESIRQFFNYQKNGRIYGIRKYKNGITTMEKLGGNAGIAVPTPGTAITAAINPYAQEKSIFAWYNVNGGALSDGSPVVYAFEGDSNFALAHETYDTCTARMPIFYRQDEYDDYIDTWYSDTQYAGFDPEDAAIMPDGSIRPYILTAKYALSYDGAKYRSTSGLNVRLRDISHNSLISKVNMADGGGAISYADVWYIHAMFDLMFADYNTQTYLAGCVSYNIGCAPTVAEVGVKRVIIPTSTAKNLIIGSCMMLGTNTNHDRYYCYEIFDGANITSIETYDDTNSAVYVDTEDSFDTTTSMYFQTRPWRCGCTDAIVGGLGSPTDIRSSKEPFVFQGLELSMGMYEIPGDLVAKSVGEGFVPYKLLDQSNASSSAPTSRYQALDVIYANATDAWVYPKYSKIYDGVSLAGPIFGASSTTGICDGYYVNKMTTNGSREFQLFGHLSSGSVAGLRCVHLGSGLWSTRWNLGSRRSYVGRKGVNSA